MRFRFDRMQSFITSSITRYENVGFCWSERGSHTNWLDSRSIETRSDYREWIKGEDEITQFEAGCWTGTHNCVQESIMLFPVPWYTDTLWTLFRNKSWWLCIIRAFYSFLSSRSHKVGSQQGNCKLWWLQSLLVGWQFHVVTWLLQTSTWETHKFPAASRSWCLFMSLNNGAQHPSQIIFSHIPHRHSLCHYHALFHNTFCPST